MGAKQPKRWKNERNNEYKAHKKTTAKNRRYNMWLNAGGALWCASHHINNRQIHTQTHTKERKWAQSSPRGGKMSAITSTKHTKRRQQRIEDITCG